MISPTDALKKNGNAEGTHSNISSIPPCLFDIIFIETNDAYRNRLRQVILEKLSERQVCIIPPLKKDPFHKSLLNGNFQTHPELSKLDERIP